MKSIKEKNRTKKKNDITKTHKKNGSISFLNEIMKNRERY